MKEIKYCPVCGKDLVSSGDVCTECSSDIPIVPANPNDIKLALLENKWNIAIVLAIVVVCSCIVGFGPKTSTTEPASSNNIIENANYNNGNTTAQETETVTEELYDEDFYDCSYDIACERYLTYDDIKDLNKEDLRIMRNWIFARHGYIFKSADLKEYFGQQPWYTPRYKNVNSMLSDIEEYNIAFIKRYE